jgi:hypothetical protein
VAAGPGTVSRRGPAPIGRVGPGAGLWSAAPAAGAGPGTRQAQSPGGLTAYGPSRSDSLLEAAWSRDSRQFIYVYSFMHLGFFLIDLFSDYKTNIMIFSLLEAALMALSP